MTILKIGLGVVFKKFDKRGPFSNYFEKRVHFQTEFEKIPQALHTTKLCTVATWCVLRLNLVYYGHSFKSNMFYGAFEITQVAAVHTGLPQYTPFGRSTTQWPWYSPVCCFLNFVSDVGTPHQIWTSLYMQFPQRFWRKS